MYNRINKDYQKIDLSRDYVPMTDVSKYLYAPDIFGFTNAETLLRDGVLKKIKDNAKNERVMIDMKAFKAEMLRRECCCWKDYALYRKELYSKPRHQNMRRRNRAEKYVEVRIILKGRNIKVGKFNPQIMPQIDKMVKEIQNYEYLFEEELKNPWGVNKIGNLVKYGRTKGMSTLELLRKYCA